MQIFTKLRFFFAKTSLSTSALIRLDKCNIKSSKDVLEET